MYSLPSWVPDWSRNLDQVLFYAPNEDSPPFRASFMPSAILGTESTNNTNNILPSCLKVQAIYLDDLDCSKTLNDFTSRGSIFVDSWSRIEAEQTGVDWDLISSQDNLTGKTCSRISQAYFNCFTLGEEPRVHDRNMASNLRFICSRNFIDTFVYFTLSKDITEWQTSVFGQATNFGAFAVLMFP
jgi:hypothetical protein